jgi:hypothetical protein
MTSAIDRQVLYDQDFNLWLLETVDQLKSQRFDQIDVENLVEELLDLSKRQQRELLTRLDVLLNHLLKRLYVPLPENYRGWEVTIRAQRKQLKRLLEMSPSLKASYPDTFGQAWDAALAEAREDYPAILFPDRWPLAADPAVMLSVKFWEEG